METIGQRIAAILVERGMSQNELSKRSGVAQGYLNALIAGKRPKPGYDVMKRIARALNVELSDLDPDLRPNALRAATSSTNEPVVAALEGAA